MKTSMQYLIDEISSIKKDMKHGSSERLYLTLVESTARYYLDLNKKEIGDAWLDGQGNIPHYSEWSSEDYADASEYIKHTYPTL